MMEPTPPPISTSVPSAYAGAPNCRYCMSLAGIVKTFELLFGFIVCFSAGVYCIGGSCNSSFYEQDGADGQGFVLFVYGMGTLFVFIFWFLHFFTTESVIGKNFIRQMEGLFYFGFGILMFIACCVESWYATASSWTDNWKSFHSQWIAAALFAWLEFFLFVFDLFRQFQNRNE